MDYIEYIATLANEYNDAAERHAFIDGALSCLDQEILLDHAEDVHDMRRKILEKTSELFYRKEK